MTKRKNGHIRKLLALLLALVSIISLFSMAAYAAAEPEKDVETEEISGTAEPSEEGKSGEEDKDSEEEDPDATEEPAASEEPEETPEPEPIVEQNLLLTAPEPEPEPEPAVLDIANAAELRAFAESVNGGTAKTQNARLTASININDEAIVIGTAANPYTGTFEGGNFTISGLVTCLFGNTSGATIQNVILRGKIESGSGILGMLCASAEDTDVINCVSTGSIEVNATYVGGLVGEMHGGSVKECSNQAEISVEAEALGGLVGYAASVNFADSVNEGTLTNNTMNVGNAGGIVGVLISDNYSTEQEEGWYDITVTNSLNKKDVFGYMGVGGIVGSSKGAYIEFSYNRGKITALHGYAGGVCGLAEYGSISKASNEESIIGPSYIGGMCGYSQYTSYDYCRNMSDINAPDPIYSFAAGIVPDGRVINCKYCYNVGTITAISAFPLTPGHVESCYYRGDYSAPADNMLTDAEIRSGAFKNSQGEDELWVGYHESYWSCRSSTYPTLSTEPICTPKGVKISKITTDFVYDGEPIVTALEGDCDITVSFTMHDDCKHSGKDCTFDSYAIYNDGEGWSNVAPVDVGAYELGVETVNATWRMGTFFIAPLFTAPDEVVFSGKPLDDPEAPALTAEIGATSKAQFVYYVMKNSTWVATGTADGAASAGKGPVNVGRYKLRVVLPDGNYWDSTQTKIVPYTIQESDFDPSILSDPIFDVNTPEVGLSDTAIFTKEDYVIEAKTSKATPIEKPAQLKIKGKGNCTGEVSFEYVIGVPLTEGKTYSFSANYTGTYFVGQPGMWFTVRGDETLYPSGVKAYLRGGQRYHFSVPVPEAEEAAEG